jgi:hypothetical protein
LRNAESPPRRCRHRVPVGRAVQAGARQASPGPASPQPRSHRGHRVTPGGSAGLSEPLPINDGAGRQGSRLPRSRPPGRRPCRKSTFTWECDQNRAVSGAQPRGRWDSRGPLQATAGGRSCLKPGFVIWTQVLVPRVTDGPCGRAISRSAVRECAHAGPFRRSSQVRRLVFQRCTLGDHRPRDTPAMSAPLILGHPAVSIMSGATRVARCARESAERASSSSGFRRAAA